jgi:hypothetical protein
MLHRDCRNSAGRRPDSSCPELWGASWLLLPPAGPALEPGAEQSLHEIERCGGHLPGFVRQEFEDYLKCGLLEYGFLRVRCDGCRYEQLVAFIRHRDLSPLRRLIACIRLQGRRR